MLMEIDMPCLGV